MTSKPIQAEVCEVTDTFADDFSDDPVIHTKGQTKEVSLRQGGEFNFKNMLKNQSDDRNGADSQLIDEEDKPIVT